MELDPYNYICEVSRPSRRGVSRNNITVEGDVNDGVSPLPQGRE